MKALEERLEATEIALSATLLTLQNQAAGRHIDDALIHAISNSYTRKISKAERNSNSSISFLSSSLHTASNLTHLPPAAT